MLGGRARLVAIAVVGLLNICINYSGQAVETFCPEGAEVQEGYDEPCHYCSIQEVSRQPDAQGRRDKSSHQV